MSQILLNIAINKSTMPGVGFSKCIVCISYTGSNKQLATQQTIAQDLK